MDVEPMALGRQGFKSDGEKGRKKEKKTRRRL